jgi:hypothetical protein
MNQTQRLYPSALPDGEAAMAGAPSFESACMSVVSDLATVHGWHLGKSILTRSDVWGLVWRIDFQVRGQSQDSKLINRYVCWGTADGKVLGTAAIFSQKVEPL